MTEDHSITASIRSRRIRELQARVEELEDRIKIYHDANCRMVADFDKANKLIEELEGLIREMKEAADDCLLGGLPEEVRLNKILSRPIVKEIMEAK